MHFIRKINICTFVCLSLFTTNNLFGISTSEIEAKLQAQFARYDAAKIHIVKEAGHKQNKLHRDEWESLLKSKSELSASELTILRNYHASICATNAQKSKGQSVINLDKLRTNKQLLQKFCKELPKGGMLHVHPSGTINREVAHTLLQQNNPTISHDEIHTTVSPWFAAHEYDFLKKLSVPTKYRDLDSDTQKRLIDLYVLPNGNSHSFDRFIGLFIIQYLCRNDANHMAVAEVIIRNFLTRAKEHGVIYVEFNNHAMFDYPIKHETLPQLAAHVKQWEKEYGITVRFNHAFVRIDDNEITHAQANNFLELDSPYITGIDLLGNETDTPAFEKGQAVYATINAAVTLNSRQLNCTMHAGELGDKRNPRDAIILGAKRLGHGVSLIDDVITLEYARRQQLGIETNIISNQRLGVHLTPSNHPFLTYLRLGLKPSLSTDDEGMFETDISHEFFIAIAETDIHYAEVKQLVLNSIDTAFADVYTKQRLRNKLIEQFKDFEQRWV